MTTENPQELLMKLSPREREVLKLLCSGLDNKTMAKKLRIKPATVRVVIGNIYIKLNLDIHNETNTRKMLLFQVFCPALEDSLPVDIARKEPVNIEESALMVVPPEVEEMVIEDEKALIPLKPDIIIDPPIRPRPGGTLRGIVIGVILMAVVGGGLWAVFGGGSDGGPQAPPDVDVIVVTATSSPAQPTEIATEQVVPTLTNEPPTDTQVPPTPTDIPSPTPVPDTDPGALVEEGEWWVSNGVWLRVDKVNYVYTGQFQIYLTYWNRTGKDQLFSWNWKTNTRLTDNTDHEYEFDWTSAFDNMTENEIIESGEQKVLNIGNSAATVSYYDDYIFNSLVSDLYFEVRDLSVIPFAQFHIER